MADNKTKAVIEDSTNTSVLYSNALTVESRHRSESFTMWEKEDDTDPVTTRGGVGIGIAFALTVAKDSSEAYINRDVDADGAVLIYSDMAAGSKAMQDYANRQSQIRNYIDSLKFSGLQNQMQQSAQIMQGMPRSSEIPYTGQVVSMETPAQPGYSTGLSDVDWGEIVQNYWPKSTIPTPVLQQTYIPSGTTGADPMSMYAVQGPAQLTR